LVGDRIRGWDAGGWPDIYTPTELFEKLLPDPGVWRSSSVACDVERPTIRVQALHIGAGFHKVVELQQRHEGNQLRCPDPTK